MLSDGVKSFAESESEIRVQNKHLGTDIYVS